VPLAFPSHPGLIAPFWRRWPHRFDALGCGIGAATPDVVDGILGIARGHLGQWYGHSLIGLFVLDVPVALALVVIARKLAMFRNLPRATLGRLTFAVWFGSLSHVVFDFISHESFLLLLPFYESKRVFPTFWYARWFEVPLPGYREPYPIGPHFTVWLALSVLGALMFFRKSRHE
jgi:Domain of unknown function (DUF4184)